MRTSNSLAGLAGLIGFIAAGGALAAPLAAATFEESAVATCFGTESQDGADDFVPEIVNVDLSSASCQAISDVFTAGIVNDPFISLQLHADGTSASASGSADISYRMRVNGPSGTFVPVHVTAAFNINGTVGGRTTSPGDTILIYGEGSAVILGLPTSLGGCTWWVFHPQLSCPNGPEGGTSGDIDQITNLYVGTEFSIIMQARAKVGVIMFQGDTLTPHSEIDLVIDPHFEFVNPDDALLYSFEFSPNMTQVPAPGAAWLFAAGLGLLGGRLRRRA